MGLLSAAMLKPGTAKFEQRLPCCHCTLHLYHPFHIRLIANAFCICFVQDLNGMTDHLYFQLIYGVKYPLFDDKRQDNQEPEWPGEIVCSAASLNLCPYLFIIA